MDSIEKKIIGMKNMKENELALPSPRTPTVIKRKQSTSLMSKIGLGLRSASLSGLKSSLENAVSSPTTPRSPSKSNTPTLSILSSNQEYTQLPPTPRLNIRRPSTPTTSPTLSKPATPTLNRPTSPVSAPSSPMLAISPIKDRIAQKLRRGSISPTMMLPSSPRREYQHVMLIGALGTGKSTFYKQLCSIPEDCNNNQAIIYICILDNLKIFCDYFQKHLTLDFTLRVSCYVKY